MSAITAGVAMTAAVAMLLAGERAGREALRVPAKLAASAVFVLAAVARYRGGPYDAWLVLGLLLCAAGDAALLHPRGLAPGLAAFLLGHLAFLAAFHALEPLHRWPVNRLAPVIVVSGIAVNRLWPHLGRLRWAVLAYVTVISLMVWGAAATLGGGGGAARLRLGGAVLFYLSDLFVARDRFVRRAFMNRALGLPLYYAGQLMLAFTAGSR